MHVPFTAIIVGGLLLAAGIFSYTTGTPDPETGRVSPTALIPALFGGLLDLCGALAIAGPALRKHAMHFAAMIGLLGLLGGFMPIIRGYSKTGTVDFSKPAVMTGLLMSGLCLGFVVVCVKSFRDARAARDAANTAI